MMRLPAS